MTIMFAAFEGRPMILRLYGKATVIHMNDAPWAELISLFDPLPGVRQILDLEVDLVQTSCGMGVPLFDYVGDRQQLDDWASGKGEQGIRQYWSEKNRFSLDGIPTHIITKSVEGIVDDDK